MKSFIGRRMSSRSLLDRSTAGQCDFKLVDTEGDGNPVLAAADS